MQFAQGGASTQLDAGCSSNREEGAIGLLLRTIGVASQIVWGHGPPSPYMYDAVYGRHAVYLFSINPLPSACALFGKP